MTESTLTGKRVLMIVPKKQFREEEVFGPRKALQNAGADVVLAAPGGGNCYGMNGESLVADVSLDEQSHDTYDAIVIAGGTAAPYEFWKNKTLQSLVTAANEAGKVIAASSLSTVVLAKAGILSGKRATSYYLPEAIDELGAAGATYVTEGVVVDGRVITGEGPAAVDAFSAAIVSALSPVPTATA